MLISPSCLISVSHTASAARRECRIPRLWTKRDADGGNFRVSPVPSSGDGAEPAQIRQARSGAGRSWTGDGSYFVIVKCPRRFCCQQVSFDSVQDGFSLPELMRVTALAVP